MNKLPHVAVLGATGAVGQEFIRLFEEANQHLHSPYEYYCNQREYNYIY